MTSALKLFYNRRTRLGYRNDTVDDLGLDSSPADGSSHHRTTTGTAGRRHHHHLHNSHNNRRDHRQDTDGCNPSPRRIHRHRVSEHEAVQVEQNGSPLPSGSIINSEDFRNIRRWGATVNDRLPGVVLLARERLLERLRGVHVSENRQSNRPSSSIHQDEFLSTTNLSLIEPNNVQLAEPVSEDWQAVRNRPPGLSQEAINLLSMEVFNNGEEERECSICLEGFEDGDEFISLACFHRFHSCCLFPWIQVCGACPNCRTPILVNCN